MGRAKVVGCSGRVVARQRALSMKGFLRVSQRPECEQANLVRRPQQRHILHENDPIVRLGIGPSAARDLMSGISRVHQHQVNSVTH